LEAMKFPWWQLGITTVGLAGLAMWQNAVSTRGAMTPPDALATAGLSPLQRAFRTTGTYLSDVGRVVLHRDDLASENARLRQRLANVQGQNQRLLRYQRENTELRKLLKMPRIAGGKNLAAEVVLSQDSDLIGRLTLNVGSRQGVKPKDVVYCPEGLVGQVTQVAPWTCVVTLPIDREGAVGAMVARSGAKAVLLGTGNRVAKLSYLDFNADVREGDLVVTSGLVRGRGGVFPPGIVVGRVLKVEKDAAYSRQDAFVEPAVAFDKVTSVFVRVGADTSEDD
jgi:rod shape-determining protein MreC